jgi:hypothetical protein
MQDWSAVERRPRRCRPVLGQARSVKAAVATGCDGPRSTSRHRRSASRSPASSSTARSSRAAPGPRPRPVCCRSSQSCWQRSGPPRACRPRSNSPPARLRAQRLRGHRPSRAALPPRHGVGLLGGRVCEGGRQAHPATRRPAHLRHAHAPGAQRAGGVATDLDTEHGGTDANKRDGAR